MVKLLLHLARPVFVPGDTVQGEAVLQTERPLSVRKITVEATGFERTVITEQHGVGKNSHTVTYTERNQILNWGAIVGPAGELPPGECRLPFEFQLPPGALPTYHGRCATTFYCVRANADIPVWFDAGQSMELPVLMSRRSCPEDQSPRAFSTENPDDPSRPGFIARLYRSSFFAGNPVEGSVTLTSSGGHRVRKATVTLNTLERASAQGRTSLMVSKVARCEIPGDELGPERAAPFCICAPADAPGEFCGMYSSLKWEIEIKLDVAWGFDVGACQQIAVYNAV
jgi:hypothetical protein